MEIGCKRNKYRTRVTILHVVTCHTHTQFKFLPNQNLRLSDFPPYFYLGILHGRKTARKIFPGLIQQDTCTHVDLQIKLGVHLYIIFSI